MKKSLLFKIVMTGVLIALNVIMERFMSYSVWNMSIGFSFITIGFASVFLGIPYAIAVGTIGDIIGALLFPFGPYFPGFTLTNALMAFTTSIFLYKNTNIFKISLSVFINKTVFSLILNSIWIAILYKGGISELWAVAITRVPTACITFFVEIVVLILLFSQKSKFRQIITKSIERILKNG